MKLSTQARHVLLATALASPLFVFSTGCTGSGTPLASMNPFSSATPASGSQVGSEPAESIAAKASGTGNQFRTLSTTAKSAYGKTKGAVAKLFGKEPAPENAGTADDPLRLDNQPNSIGPEVFVANGQLWESTGNFTKAMESYTSALQSEPNNPPALTSIARLHFRQGNHRQAADYFRKAIEQSPEDASLHHDLGLTLSKMNDHTGATQALTRALELAPGTSRYANSLASAKFEAGKTEAAYNVLSENNKPAVAHFNMAYLHFKSGQMSDARGHLAKAIEFEPLAASDSAVKRAVERSREMLAQIDGPISDLAQAEAEAKIAARPAPAASPGGADNGAVRQTSQQTEIAAPADSSRATTAQAASSTSSAGDADNSTAAPSGETPSFSLPAGFQMPGNK